MTTPGRARTLGKYAVVNKLENVIVIIGDRGFPESGFPFRDEKTADAWAELNLRSKGFYARVARF